MDLQIDAQKKVNVDKIFEEKITGAKKERPELSELLKVIRPGDTINITFL
ncbi:recombinase family protein [Candidatus Enterococcus ikei]|uniref:Recombinase family protein n=1 Tax=Candidatus Enterococcus ikei TaxID=2815326 RepID=A0ABS3H0G0_9ENTE|nr:recombinase family protein [Enterococcus sp. DIV0869a]